MKKGLVFRTIIILLLSLIILLFYSNFVKKKEVIDTETSSFSDNNNNSNIIKDVSYVSKDSRGNEYIINALEGQIDLSNNKTIFLTKVRAIINLNDSSEINIISDFGKYNIDNYDTIFSKNVIITYMDHKILGNYLDFSLNRNSMIVSKDVIYNNQDKTLKADVIEINIKTKHTKIYMYEQNKKVNIKSKN
mgnify:CR=1 FL=1|tara:strand:- start:7436 stop:8008 length:573 start_codon:yes stop_codon:yes gene_type:complete